MPRKSVRLDVVSDSMYNHVIQFDFINAFFDLPAITSSMLLAAQTDITRVAQIDNYIAATQEPMNTDGSVATIMPSGAPIHMDAEMNDAPQLSPTAPSTMPSTIDREGTTDRD
jgi:hypothetical protein